MHETSITSAALLLEELHDGELPELPARCVLSHLPLFDRVLRERHPHRRERVGRMTLDVFEEEALVRGLQGAPAAAIQIELLIAAGFRQFALVGTAGHPHVGAPMLGIGDTVCVTGALVYEGTSRHYGWSEDRIENVPPSRLAELADRRGMVATTDAIFRETPSWIAEVVERGAMAIDMELSALMSVCRARGASLDAVVVVSDLVGPNAWRVGFSSPAVAATARRLAASWPT